TGLSRGAFLDPFNLQSMGAQLPELGLLAIGVALAMISGNGGIDLSGIALANLAGVCAALCVPHFVDVETSPWSFTVAFCVTCVVVGMLGGLLNGLLIARVGLTPILCTLGTQMLFTGLCVVVSGGVAVRVAAADPLLAIGDGVVLGVPIPFILFGAVVLGIGALLKFTPFGWRLFLLGTNPKAARYAGLPLRFILLATYATSGAIAGLAAVLIASRAVNVKWDYGQSYLLIAILIAVMAGVRPAGGYGRMSCLFFSATALQLLSSMLNFSNVSNFLRDCAWGLLLLVFLATTRFEFRSLLAREATGDDLPVQCPPASTTNN
ncbi:MAG TPA: ABC transporter permease, partial [Burkholderiaceae bacterium]|nr:ABC transporter permease [Burkholderiaceae bacterium]